MPSFALIGVDAFLFNIDPLSGLITLRDWFMPDAEDPWDADQDGTYDFAVEVTQDDGTVEVFPAGLDVAPDGSVTLTITHDIVEVDESGSELDDALRPDLTGDVLDSPDLPERITPQPETEANPGEVITGDLQPTGNELLVNGQLNYDVPNGRWTQTDQVEGWSNDNGNVEAWTDGFLGANSADGSGILELDVRSGGQVDTLSQTVETQAGSEITLSFSAAQRGSDNDSIEVYWRGELIDTVTPSEGNDFETFEFTVTGSGGEDVLEFRELASENDGTGPLFDNISLVEHEMVEVELLQNSELNNNLTNGRYGFRSENDGWTNSNGSVEVWADGFLGADSGDGTGVMELDVGRGSNVDTLTQTVATEAGDEMTLSFSAAQRGSDNDSIEVYWRGELIDTVTPSLGNDFETFTYTVTGSGGDDVLEFRELASENDGTGPLFDNISLVTYERATVEVASEDTLIGTDADDTLNGGREDDEHYGGAGNDILQSNQGSDLFDGGAGIDTYQLTSNFDFNVDLEAGHDNSGNTLVDIESVIGFGGDDTLSGTSGDNLLSGGYGNDELVGRAGDDVLLGGFGNDIHDGGEGNDIFIANYGSDTFAGGAGEDSYIINNSEVEDFSFSINLQAGLDQYGNVYSGIENVDGGNGNDNILGTDTSNVLLGRVGDDTIDGAGGDDILIAGTGNDEVYGGAGNDFIVAGEGADHYSGGEGTDTYDIDVSDDYLTSYGVNLETGADQLGNTYEGIENVNGGWGDDTLTGDAANNLLDGGVGDDVIRGGAGNDSVAGGLGNDIVDGGEGDDVLFGSHGVDTYIGGEGTDQLFIGGEFNAPANYNIDLQVGADQFGNSYDGIENINVGAGDDNILGDDENNQFFGNEGDDTLNGAGGENFLNGGIGNDVFVASEGNNFYFGDSGVDTLQIAGSSMDGEDYQINLEEGVDNQGSTSFGVENVNAGSGDDSIFGGSADNALHGGAGNDTLLGGGGDDTLTGGEGNDNFGLEGIAGNVNITDFTKGEDRIDVSGIEGVNDIDDLVEFLIAGDGSSTLSFDLDNDEQLRVLIEGEEELEESDFLF